MSETDDEFAVEGDEIRFMWDFGVIVPWWTDDGLLPDEPEWLRRALGLSEALILALTRPRTPSRDLQNGRAHFFREVTI